MVIAFDDAKAGSFCLPSPFVDYPGKDEAVNMFAAVVNNNHQAIQTGSFNQTTRKDVAVSGIMTHSISVKKPRYNSIR